MCDFYSMPAKLIQAIHTGRYSSVSHSALLSPDGLLLFNFNFSLRLAECKLNETVYASLVTFWGMCDS